MHQFCTCGKNLHGPSRRDVLALLCALGAAPGSGVLSATANAAEPAGSRGAGTVRAFELGDVRLLDGPFLHAQKQTAAYLKALSADRLLHGFRVNAGLAPKAPVYGGWESEQTWADIHCHGHSLGHYLSACSMMAAATDDPFFKDRVAYIVSELAACQQAAGSGLLSAFPEGHSLVTDFIAGKKISGVPWYTLHKVYAGLRDAHQLAGNAEAREVLLRFADWAVAATASLSDAQFETMLNTEHGGMNEVFADLFALTGKADYRQMALRFSHKAVLAPLARGQDHLDGLHANTQIPKIVGFRRVHDVTGEAGYGPAAAFFWRTVVRSRSYATGGHGDGEHFFAVADTDKHVFSAKGAETCGVHNMLKLTRLLFMQDPQAAYADFYERALFNSILGSQDPDTGMVTYFQGGRPGYMKLYCTPVDSFWCCTGTGMENHAKYGDSIYFHDERSLTVNLFIPSVLTWKAQDAVLTQTTLFPEAESTRLQWRLASPKEFSLKLRHPGWSPKAEVRINGRAVGRFSNPGAYIVLNRTWKDGDVVKLVLSMQVAVEPLASSPGIFAFTYGPLVLAGALGREGIAPGADIVINERRVGEYLNTPFEAPRLAGDPAALARKVRQGSQPLTFTVPDAHGRPVRLKPYHQIAHERYVTYWQTTSVSAT
ncbi:MAG: glycoside hydrolase family 127 protein [Alphaproteobacteria bacterium]|nr:glycoside hydrolase family 127 protein [Alphaproteobacteria bacterium]